MKKLFKFLGFTILSVVIIFVAFYFIKNEKLPEGHSSLDADKMAMEMLESINKTAWDTTYSVSWTFKGGHHYNWNIKKRFVTIKWDENEVGYQTDQNTVSITNKEKYTQEELHKIEANAIAFFNNDSFWLCAPYKVFDPGTERSIVTLKDGREGLMVTYTSGGSTPGDSYVCILDENNRPTSVKMWVSILPIGGMEFTWENYKVLSSGAMLAKDHHLYGMLNLDIDIKD